MSTAAEARSGARSAARVVLHGVLVVAGAFVFALALFLVLPLIQAISQSPLADTDLRGVDTANLPPPPPPPPEEEKEEEEPEPEEQPPELLEDAPPLDLSQLELALGGGVGDGWLGGDFAVKLDTKAATGADADALFSLQDLDQKPRVIHQPSPILDKEARKRLPGSVYVLFVVGQDGRVESPIAQSSTDPVFERPALAAVKQWKFEPGKRNGQPVRFRMRVPITFPKGS
ncbi:MAG: energy transducer TonB [Planctomycetes bacterium]|nr:energy transducer TonB [Planctomycetota bacterium]